MLLLRVQAATEGEYLIEGELGRGGMAAVFLARDISLDRRVAIKVMLPDLLSVAGIQDRFVIEARTAAHLDHVGIVTVYSVKQREGLLFIVMKFVDGRTLDTILKDERPLPLPVVASIISQVAEALHFAHQEGIIHRDVKPSNIIIDTRGRPVVTDFGIAKVTTARSITLTGTMIGTPAYMSPEQCRGLPATAASDQYSLGVMAYEMLSRRLPFDGTLFELIHAHSNEAPPPLTEVAAGIDAETAAIVHRMLDKNPRERYPSLAEVAAHFTQVGNAGGRVSNVRAMIAALARTPDATVQMPRRPQAIDISGAETEVTSTPTPELVITPPSPSIEVGESVQLRVSESSGASMAGVRILWRSEDASVATVDENGVVTGRSVGLAKITAGGGSASGRVAVTVKAPRVDTLVVTPQSPELVTDNEIQFVATVLDARGTVIVGQSIVWTSSDVAVCAVSQQGRAIGVAPGRATVSALCGSVSGSATVKVKSPAVERVFVEPGEVAIEVEETRRLVASALGPMDRRLEGRPTTWRSTAPTVVTVSADGAILGVTPGTAAVIATCDGKEGLTSVSVRRQPVTAVRIQPARLQLEIGRSLQLQGVGEDRRGRAVPNEGLEWHSDDDRIALVDTSGKVHAVREGQTVVRAIAGEVTASIDVTVVARAAAQVRLDPHEPRLSPGEFVTLDATVLDADGSTLAGRAVTWTSSDPDVVSVSDKGVCEAKRGGSVRITATCEKVRATTKLSVTPVGAAARETAATAQLAAVGMATQAGGARGRRTMGLVAGGAVLVVAVTLAFVMRGSGSRSAAFDPNAGKPPVPGASDSVPNAGNAVPNAKGESRAEAPAKPAETKPVASGGKGAPAPASAPGLASTSRGGRQEQAPPTSAARKAVDSVAALPSRGNVASQQARPESTATRPAVTPLPVPTSPPPQPVSPQPVPPQPVPPRTEAAAPASSGRANEPPADADRAVVCGNASFAESALNDALAADPAATLGTLYRPRDAADGRAKDALLLQLKDMQRLKATARSVRNEAAADGCAWVMTLELAYTNAFSQARKKTGQVRLQLEAVGGRARAKQLFGASGF
ncbi:MAG: Ig-like domain-containing protein [Gemmatimonadales bacterium]